MASRDDDITIWGELREGLHIAGYSFERACKRLESLLEDNRWKVGGKFKTINAFLDSLSFATLKASAEARKRIANRIKELQPKARDTKIAKLVGVERRTIAKDLRADGTNVPSTKGKGRAGGTNVPSVSGADAAKIVERREGGIARTQEQRAERERKLGAKIAALPSGRYGVIVADPAWHDEVYSEQTGMDRHASRHYTTTDIDTIKALPVATIAADDCVLFLWSTNQHLDVAIDVLRAWGFEYASHYIWRKPTIGLGYWNRSVHEILLIGTRGSVPCPALGTQKDSIIDAPRGEHSAKPEAFLEMIEGYFPTMPKIELNRRGSPRSGWSAWGNQVKEAAE